jgi:hypothetical protein
MVNMPALVPSAVFAVFSADAFPLNFPVFLPAALHAALI